METLPKDNVFVMKRILIFMFDKKLFMDFAYKTNP